MRLKGSIVKKKELSKNKMNKAQYHKFTSKIHRCLANLLEFKIFLEFKEYKNSFP